MSQCSAQSFSDNRPRTSLFPTPQKREKMILFRFFKKTNLIKSKSYINVGRNERSSI